MVAIYVSLVSYTLLEKNKKNLLNLFLQKGKIDGAVPGLWLQVQARYGQRDPRKPRAGDLAVIMAYLRSKSSGNRIQASVGSKTRSAGPAESVVCICQAYKQRRIIIASIPVVKEQRIAGRIIKKYQFHKQQTGYNRKCSGCIFFLFCFSFLFFSFQHSTCAKHFRPRGVRLLAFAKKEGKRCFWRKLGMVFAENAEGNGGLHLKIEGNRNRVRRIHVE